MDIFNTYNNINFYINRVKPYNPKGRNQTEVESDALDYKIKKLYADLDIPFEYINGDDEGYQYVVKSVLNLLKTED
jgi:hypothetical protein